VSFALASSVTQAAVNSNWRGTILCTAQTALGGRSLGVDDQGHVAELMLRRAVPPGWRVDVREGAPSMSRGALSAHSAGTIRVLGRAKEPFIVRTRLIEDGYAHYGFYRRGRPWLGCRVRFDGAAAVSVAKLILSGQAATLTLGLHDGKLVHLGPQERARSGRGEAAKARADLQRFLALIAHGRSVAACATLARDALLIHGGPDGCIMDFESAKFIYRDRYAHASVERIALFTLGGDSYALATINRGSSRVCAFLVRERGRGGTGEVAFGGSGGLVCSAPVARTENRPRGS
jgi:hypothetical protein